MNAFFIKSLLPFVFMIYFASSLSAAPMIKVDSADFYAGEIKEGEQKSVKHTFIIKNTGDEVLKIEKVKPG